MALATSLRKVASKLISKFGGEITFRHVTTGVYSTTTGAATPSVTTTTVRGVLEDVSEREAGELVKASDKKLTIAAADLSVIPTTEDQFDIGGTVHQIIIVKTLEQDNTPITYEFILRA